MSYYYQSDEEESSSNSSCSSDGEIPHVKRLRVCPEQGEIFSDNDTVGQKIHIDPNRTIVALKVTHQTACVSSSSSQRKRKTDYCSTIDVSSVDERGSLCLRLLRSIAHCLKTTYTQEVYKIPNTHLRALANLANLVRNARSSECKATSFIKAADELLCPQWLRQCLANLLLAVQLQVQIRESAWMHTKSCAVFPRERISQCYQHVYNTRTMVRMCTSAISACVNAATQIKCECSRKNSCVIPTCTCAIYSQRCSAACSNHNNNKKDRNCF